MTQQKRPRRQRRNIVHGQAHIKASFNNTIISITDLEGNAVDLASDASRFHPGDSIRVDGGYSVF